MAQTADRMERIRRIPAMDLTGSPFGSKASMKRVQWQPDDGDLTRVPSGPLTLKHPDKETTTHVDTIGDLLIAYAFWPDRP